ncbi:unnamed protein product [Mytilus edulis]|uniref:Uncharacterized protein n=1 Tax=Mytilus edulis TaxID=6550 RepID=A0A8S3QVB8_MYTED|nr:unnamed protein product [Mytilus edulis]
MFDSIPSDLPSNTRYLYFDHQLLQNLSSLNCNQLPNLQYLYINNNQIEVIQDTDFLGCSSLIILNIRNNLLTEIRNGTFNGLTSLQNLIKVRQQAVSQTVLDTDTDTKVLGMRWNSHTDYLLYPHKCKEDIPTKLVTKREILRYSSGIYDPLGLLSPVTITAKILLQEIWKLGLQWDSIIEGDICNQWIDNIETDNIT